MKQHQFLYRVLSLILVMAMLWGSCPTTVSAADSEVGTTTFVYAGSNKNITGANLCFYVTWGTATYNDNAENCGITLIPDGNSVTLQIDKQQLKDSTVWMNIWDNVVWTNWKGVSCTFTGETYYIDDTSVSTTPPSGYEEPQPEETEPQVEYATTTFVYVGSNETITGANLHFYVTWGTATYEANAENCGITLIPDGNSVTLQIDKQQLKDSTVWLNIWDDVVWTNWNGVSCTFTGETYYIYDDSVSTTPPSEPEETEPEETEPEETEPEETEPEETEPQVEYGTTTFVYVGSNETITGANLHFYVTWGTATYEANAEDCGIILVPDGNSVTLQIDKQQLKDSTVWLNIWDDVVWTNWQGVSCTFSGDTYYLYDDSVSTTPPSEPEETEPEETEPEETEPEETEPEETEPEETEPEETEPEETEPEETEPEETEPEETEPEETLPEGNYVTTTFVYAGSNESITAANLHFYVTWGTATYEANAEDCGIILVPDGNSVTLYTDKANLTDSTVWMNIWDDLEWTNWSGVSCTFTGETYYIYDDRVSAASPSEPTEPTEPAEPTTEYSITVHCYGEGYQLGAWLCMVENGEETGWTSEADGRVAALENLQDGWTSATVSWDLAETYNRLGFSVGTDDPWTGTRYAYDFSSPAGGEVWIVPGYEGVYSSAEEALAHSWKYYYKFKIHCYGEGYQVGAWLAKVSGGEEVSWLDTGSSVTKKFRKPQDGWTTATVSWELKAKYNRLSFQIGQDSPWESKNYAYDFTKRTGEIWIIPGDPTVYLSAEAALAALNDPASAKYSFLVHYYGEGCKIGAWLARVEGPEEVAWTGDTESELRDFEPQGDGWSQTWVRWNLEADYNRLCFGIDPVDPWVGQRYYYDFTDSPMEFWIVAGDPNVYLSRQEAEAAMAPPVETEPPAETEAPEAEPAVPETEEAPVQEEETSGGISPAVIGIGAGVILLLLLLLLLLKRKKKKEA